MPLNEGSGPSYEALGTPKKVGGDQLWTLIAPQFHSSPPRFELSDKYQAIGAGSTLETTPCQMS
jgi:hypothetical protein